MNTVTLNKQRFRQTVERNKAAHEKLFHEASAAFYKRVNAKLSAITQAVRDQEMNFAEVVVEINKLNQECPQGHCDEYQRVLDMLRYHVGETVDLHAHEFEQFFQDKWGWKQGFTASYTANTGKAIVG